VRALLAAGVEVVGVDNLNDYYDVRLKEHRLDQLLAATKQGIVGEADGLRFSKGEYSHGRFTFLPLDIEDAGATSALFRRWRFDAVINLAARAGVRYSVAHPEVYASTNLSGSVNLLQSMSKAGVKKYVLASSSSLYAGAEAPFREDYNVNRPLSPYAASKLAAEAMAFSFHHLHGIDTSVLRFFTVYGPASRPDMSPLRFLRMIDDGSPIPLYGDGTQTRDFTYVDDIVAGVIAALKPVDYEVVNLGGGNEPTAINQVIAWFEQGLGKRALIDQQPFHAGDMKDTAADVSKARELLGWTPSITPEDGFARMVTWYRANQDWLRKIKL
jgi:nucleoside-diphosphate-sugar epimerase